jgi:uncharacterized membrane protein
VNSNVPRLAHRAPLLAALVLMVPIFIHLAVLSRNPWFEWLALTIIVALPLAEGLLAGRLAAWLWFVALASSAALVVRLQCAALLLYLPSVALPGLLAWFFGRTLLAGDAPLIERIARSARGPLPDYLVAYTRRLTQAWTLLFAGMALFALLLALSGRRELWSLVTNVGNYLLVAVFVLVEYVYRRWRFSDYPHPGLLEYLRIVVRSNPRQSP